MGVLGIIGNAKSGNAAGGLGRYDVKRKNNWTLELIPDSSQSGIWGTPGTRSLLVQCYKAARPSLNVAEKDLRFTNERWYVAGVPTYDAMEVTFYDSMPSTVQAVDGATGTLSTSPDYNSGMMSAGQMMWKWWTLMYDPTTGAMGSPARYKMKGFLSMYGSASAMIERWYYVGVHPTKINFNDVDWTQEDFATVGATLRYDKVYRIDATQTQMEPTSLSETYLPESDASMG